MKSVVILSGVSGSGKSTYAEKLLNDTQGIKVSADHYFMVGGEYHFDPIKLGEAHADCFRRFITYMQVADPWPCVVVDNTNLSSEEIAPYYLAAQAFGYHPSILTIRVEGSQLGKLASCNVHGVPLGSLRAQFRKLLQRHLPPWWDNTDLPPQW
jgi:predicted kinase